MGVTAYEARIDLIAQLQGACWRRAHTPWLELFHYIFQLYRAFLQKAEAGHKVENELLLLREAYNSLGKADASQIWGVVDALLRGFPWQTKGFAEFTSGATWCRRNWRQGLPARQRLLEVDPETPGQLRPVVDDGRPWWLVMGGNRTHINGLEWQDPRILNEELIDHAEYALWKFLDGMEKLFLGRAEASEFKLVGIAPSTISSRWECRLENFAVSRLPSWSHPRNELLAADLYEQHGDTVLKRSRGTIFSAYSLGCAAAEQLMAACAKIDASGNDDWADSVYFGGYVDLYKVRCNRKRTQIISLMDECVFGSPDLPDTLHEAIKDHWFSSPFTLRQRSPWEDVPGDIEKVIANYDSGQGWSQLRKINPMTELILLAAQTSVPSDNNGQALLGRSVRMGRTRYGHFLDATLEEFLHSNHSDGILASLFTRAWSASNATQSLPSC